MRLRLITFVLMASAGLAISSVMPLTAKEVALMLRSGYSSEAVMRELSARHFADTFDPTIEKQLTQAGASTALLDGLRNGAYQLSTAEMAAVEKKRAAEEERAANVTGQSENAAPLREKKSASAQPKSPIAVDSIDEVYRLLKGDLICWRQGSISHFDDEGLQQKKLFVFFFSANWSPAGRKFTPQLIEYYNRVAPQHPEFEVIFFSADRSQFGMETYMGQSNMPWPAVAFPKIGSKANAMQTDFVRDIPCLILVSRTGRILSKSQGSEKDNGPEKVLADLDKVFARGTNSVVAHAP